MSMLHRTTHVLGWLAGGVGDGKHMRGSDVGGSGMGGKPGVHHKIVARRAWSIGEMNPQLILSTVA